MRASLDIDRRSRDRPPQWQRRSWCRRMCESSSGRSRTTRVRCSCRSTSVTFTDETEDGSPSWRVTLYPRVLQNVVSSPHVYGGALTRLGAFQATIKSYEEGFCAEPTRVPCASLERDRGGPRQAGRFRAAERYPSTHTKGPRLRRRQGDRLATEGRRRASARSARSRWPSPPVSAPVDSRDWLAGAGLVVPAPA